MQPSIQQMLVACWVLHWHHNPVFCTAPWKGAREIACQQIKELAAGCSINPHVTLCPTDAKKGRTVKKKRYKGYKTVRAANETIRVKISWIIKTWYDALRRCEEDGGFLAVLNTDTRRNFVKRIVGAHAFALEKAWIGLRDVHGNNTFVWVDGTPFFDWTKRTVKATPTNVLRKQTCVAVLIGHRLRMGTSMCDKKLPFLCQI